MARTVGVPSVTDGPLTLECDVRASNPPPTIVWYGGGSVITPILPTVILFFDNGRYLFIRSLTSVQRQQEFYCEVQDILLGNTNMRSPITYDISESIAPSTLVFYKNHTTMLTIERGSQVEDVNSFTATDGAGVAITHQTVQCQSQINSLTIDIGTHVSILLTVTSFSSGTRTLEPYTCNVLIGGGFSLPPPTDHIAVIVRKFNNRIG